METVFTAFSVVIDDFEIGDRIYYNPLKGKNLPKDSELNIYTLPIYGTVLSVNERSVKLKMDDEMNARFVHIEAFNSGGRYGRCFDESLLRKDARLSCFNGRERVYATVVSYTPNVSVSLHFPAAHQLIEIPASEHKPLGYQLATYDLED